MSTGAKAGGEWKHSLGEINAGHAPARVAYVDALYFLGVNR
jgi:hypothetical protein